MAYQTISFIGHNSVSNSSTIVLPAHQAGDVIIMQAAAKSVMPATPSGWTNITGSVGSSLSVRYAYKVAQSSSEISGSWIGAEVLTVQVYRGASPVSPIGSANVGGNGNSTIINYPSLSPLNRTDGSSWLLYSLASTEKQNLIITETGTIGTSSALRSSQSFQVEPVNTPSMIYSNGASGNRNTGVPISSVSLTAGSLQQNDVVVVVQSSYTDNPSLPTNSGIVELFSHSETNVRMRVSYKVMGATPDSSITFSTTAGSRTFSAIVMCFRNLQITDLTNITNFGSLYSYNIDQLGAAGAPNPPALTFNTDQISVVAAVGYAGWNPSAPPTGYTTAHTPLQVNYNIFNSFYTLAVAYKMNTTADAVEDPGTWTQTQVAANGWISAIFGLPADRGSNILINSHDSNGPVTSFAGDTNSLNIAAYTSVTGTIELKAAIAIPPRRVVITS